MKKHILHLTIISSLLGMSLTFLWAYQTLAAGSLLAYWQFDETTPSATVADSSGYGYNGTPHGADGSQNGPQPSTEVPTTTFDNPRSLDFDGTDDYVAVSGWNTDASGGLTVALLARPTATNGNARFIDFGNGEESDNIIFGRNNTSSDLVFKVYIGDSATTVTAPCVMTDNTWSHYAAVVDDEGNARIYRNGTAVGTGTSNLPSNLARSNMYIGRSNWEDDDYYEGQMDELRIYDRALTSDEITELASGELGPIPSPDPTPTPTPTPTAAVSPTPTAAATATATPSTVPNSGDANSDGIQDANQANVRGFISPVTSKYVVIAAPEKCRLTAATNNDAKENAVQDSGYGYPAGFLNFTANCDTPGYAATMKLSFYGLTTDTYALRKYDPATHGYATVEGASFAWQTIAGEQVLTATYQVTDGGALDADATSNGVIVDPVGPAVQKVTVPSSGC